MQPAKVVFDNDMKATLAKGIQLADFQVGMRGEVVIETTQNGEYTNHVVTSWNPTTPPGQSPAQFPSAPPAQQASDKVSQAVWDAKDRAMAMMASNKPAAEIVSALIAHGILKDLAGATAMYDALSKQGYELVILARENRVATSVDPYADDV